MTEATLKSFCNGEGITTLAKYTIFKNFYTNSYFGIYGDANYHRIKVIFYFLFFCRLGLDKIISI